MKKIVKYLQGVRFIGFKNSLNTILYSYHQDQIETRLQTNSPYTDHLTIPGSLINYEILKNKIIVHFDSVNQEVSMLDNDMFRITWSKGKNPLPFAINKSDWKPVEFKIDAKSDAIYITTSSSELRIDYSGGLEIRNSEKILVRKELAPKFYEKGWEHTALTQPLEAFYGLGERAAHLNLRGGIFQHWNRDPGGSYELGDDPLYTCIPVYLGVSPLGSYLIFYENTFKAVFDFSKNTSVRYSDGALRYYIISANLEKCFKLYTELTGCPDLPPKWSLGFHQSRWGYKSEEQIYELKSKFFEHDLPVNAIHLDIDYMNEYRVFTINEQRFPEISKLSRSLYKDNIRLVSIIDPGIKVDPNYAVYQEGKENNYFVKSSDEDDVKALVWPGWCTFPDFGNSETCIWWGNQYPKLLFSGISGVWHDMNEPAIFTAWGEPTIPVNAIHTVDDNRIEHREIHNVYGLLMNKAGYDALKIFAPNKRPWILSRSGWAGVQRYAWNWTGDVSSSWQMLRTTVSSLLNLSLSGLFYTGSDIGGFSGHPDRELYVRWFQLGAFSPFFRLHNATGLPDREPWVFDSEVLSIIRDLLHLRQQLLPYLYTLSYMTAQEGQPILRPFFWEDPTNGAYYEVEDQFFLGRDLLVAPMLYPNQYQRIVQIPKGIWYNFWNGKSYQGPAIINAEGPLNQIPVFARAGSIIPLQAENKLQLMTYFQKEKSKLIKPSGILYSDSGDGYGDYRIDHFQLNSLGNDFILEHKFEGMFPWPYEEIMVKWYGNIFDEVFIDQKKSDHAENQLVTENFNRIEFKAFS